MSAIFKVADIPIIIRSNSFLNAFSPLEYFLIKPFIRHQKLSSRLMKKTFSVDIKVVNSESLRGDFKVNPELIEKIKSMFHNHDVRFYSVFDNFRRKSLPHYLMGSRIKQKLLSDILDSNTDHNKLMISSDSFLIFDQRTLRCNAYYSLPMFLQQQQDLCDTRPYKLNILRLFLRMIMNSKNDGIMLHASSIEDRGYGYAFIGPSGSGKSTIIRMLNPARILSDDTTIIRRINDTYKLFPNPWCNDDIQIEHAGKPAALRAMFFIKQARNTSIRRLNPKDALKMLIYDDRPFHQYGFFDNKTGIKNFYLFSQELIHQIPAYELKVKKSKRFKQEFQELLSKSLKCC